MLPYRVQYNESESNIQNNNLFYKIAPKTKILFNSWKVNRLFTPQNRHAQTFPDTQSNPWTGAHLKNKNKILLDRLNVIHVETPSIQEIAIILHNYCLDEIKDFLKYICEYFTIIMIIKNNNNIFTKIFEIDPTIILEIICEFLFSK